VASIVPVSLKSIVDFMVEQTQFKGRVEWINSKLTPFSIDVEDAMEIGFKPLKTWDTITNWLSDALDKPRSRVFHAP